MMDADRFFYVMIVVIALIGVGLFAIPVRADDPGQAAATAARLRHLGPMGVEVPLARRQARMI